MSYVYMKVLESAPARYDRGMRILTLGRLDRVRQDIADRVPRGECVLDLGCGTGALAARLAEQGARVTAVDISPAMLAQATELLRQEGLGERVVLRELGVTELEGFEGSSFGAVTCMLLFSELSEDEVDYTLAECRRLLRPGGRLLVADEVLPESVAGRLLTFLLRLPFVIVAFVLTQTTTRRVRDLRGRVAAAGFQVVEVLGYLGGTLQLVVAE